MKLRRARSKVHNEFLRARQLDYLLQSPVIDTLWNDSDEDEQNALLVAVDNKDFDAIKRWIAKHRNLCLEEKTSSELKAIARMHGVRNWSRLSKPELVLVIREALKDG